jgi:hypothetical protein
MKTLTLTVDEIADLARFAGLVLDETRCTGPAEEGEIEISVGPCPEGGLYEEAGGERKHYRVIAWFDEYPEEGSEGLGPEISSPTPPEPPVHHGRPPGEPPWPK